MRGNSSIFLHQLLVRRQVSNPNSQNLLKTLISASIANTAVPKIPPFRNYISAGTSQSHKLPSLQFHRTLCSSPHDPSTIVAIKSGEEFNSSLAKVKDEYLPAIFYFTAEWCGPCRFLLPVVKELSAEYPHVTIYKIDVDQEGLDSAVSDLSISALPTILFFKHGEKAAKVVGADIPQVRTTMDQLYKKRTE